MGELRDWKEQFTSYYNSSNLRQMTYLQQQGYLLSTVDKVIGRHLRREITVTTPIFPTAGSVSCFDILTTYFSQRNPIHLRRQAFFCASQKEGQSVLDFRAQLRSLGNEGDLESMTVEGAYCLMHQLGVRDDTLRRELCMVKNPTLAVFDTILEAHALMEASEKQRQKSVQANRAFQKKPRETSQRPKLSEEEKRRRAKFKGKCFRCGATDHMVPQCKMPPNISCNSCKQSGHVAAVCERSSSARATTSDRSAGDSPQLQLQYSPGPPVQQQPPASSFYIPQQGYQDYNQPTPELPL